MENESQSQERKLVGCLELGPAVTILCFVFLLLILLIPAIPVLAIAPIILSLDLSPAWEITILLVAYIGVIVAFFLYQNLPHSRYQAILKKHGGLEDDEICWYEENERDSFRILVDFLSAYNYQVVAQPPRQFYKLSKHEAELLALDHNFILLRNPNFDSLIKYFWDNQWDIHYFDFIIQPKSSPLLDFQAALAEIEKCKAGLIRPVGWFEAMRIWQASHSDDIVILSFGDEIVLYTKPVTAFPREELLNLSSDKSSA